MKLIVGLGNPGAKYQGTRHNIGRCLIERMASSFSIRFSKNRSCQASTAVLRDRGDKLILAYPECYMNLSGEAVVRLCRHFEIEVARDLLVAVDDVALPFGRLRLRACGSDGGHNGLKSVRECLATPGYARLRIGIGFAAGLQAASPRGASKELPLEEYVLSPFDEEEACRMRLFLDEGIQACLAWLKAPIEKAMNSVNR